MASPSNANNSSPVEKYPYPPEFNVLDFVPKGLFERNYQKWKKLMLGFIKRQGLIGFIDGTAQEEIGNQDYYKAWKRSDNLVQGWILATLSEDIRLEMSDEITAKEMWEELEENFDRTTSNGNNSSPIEKYPYPTEFNVLDFVPKGLFERNYQKWKKLMLGFIERQGFVGFIDGTAQEEIGNQDYYKAWKRSDNLVQGWILATLTEDIRLEVSDEMTAKDLWDELGRRFDRTTLSWQLDEETENRLIRYAPLLKAAINGDREATILRIIEQDPDAVRAPITPSNQTALSVAIKSVNRNNFVRKLLEKMTPQDVVNLVDHCGRTALHIVAYTDNIEGARMLVKKNSDLPNVVDYFGQLPLYRAAGCGLRDMAVYLKEVTREDIISEGELLRQLTRGELYGEY
ncbi:hypothetical protein Vadar_000936 [Vaccinium darrowii]|uniref:Uncharacterized protein n=1 Tax=Vaccinium darrowii TaxID=229202 RepID=A0ACB7YJC7_9ERIC|nr:hypothetical protein Vadar_000936 [Vaccinium darrowii]